MSCWPVFLTASSVDEKVLNKAFLLIDFEFTDDPTDTSWVLVTSSNPGPSTAYPSIYPPLSSFPEGTNDFANATPTTINTFIRTHSSTLESSNLTTGNWVIIDQQGLETSTCLVVEQIIDDERATTSSVPTYRFQAVRLPFTEAHAMFCNLDIANMDFEDWADVDAGEQPDGTYKWVGPFEGSNEAQDQAIREANEKREAAFKVLKGLGHVE